MLTRIKVPLDKELKHYLINFVNKNKDELIWNVPYGAVASYTDIDTSGKDLRPELNVPIGQQVVSRGRRSITLDRMATLADDNSKVQYLGLEFIETIFSAYPDIDRTKFRVGREGNKADWDTHMLTCVYNTTDKPSHGVHVHLDANADDGYYQIRMNYMVQSPINGGNPTIDKNIFDNDGNVKKRFSLTEENISEDEGYWMMPTIWAHGCMPVEGERFRLLLSLSFHVEPEYFNNYMVVNYG
jgi:hypothetical protein